MPLSLELNLHQLVLSDLARSVGESKSSGHPSVEDAVELVSSKVETINVSFQEADNPQRVFMVSSLIRPKRRSPASKSASRVHSNIGFGELAVNIPDAHIESAVFVLIDILRDVPFIDFDKSLSWTGKKVPCSNERALMLLKNGLFPTSSFSPLFRLFSAWLRLVSNCVPPS